jgi:hypothetical protein
MHTHRHTQTRRVGELLVGPEGRDVGCPVGVDGLEVGCPVGFVGPLVGERVGLIEGDPPGAVVKRGVESESDGLGKCSI